MRRLKGWGWAGTGALAVLILIWLGVTVWTAIKQQSDETRITRIERIVTHPPRPKHHRAHSEPSQGGGAQNPSTAGQQPKPGHQPGGQGKGGHGQHHPPPHGSPAPEPAPPPATAAPAPEAQPSSSPMPGDSGETPAAERSEGVRACVTLVASACAEAGTPKFLP